MKTCMFTDWITVHDNDLVYDARVILTDSDGAYVIVVCNGKKNYFRIDTCMLKLNELYFFEKITKIIKPFF